MKERAQAWFEELRDMICTAAELETILRLPPMVDWYKVTFSAKEAFYKCYYPLVRVFLGFHDVELQIDPARRVFTAAIIAPDKPPVEGRRVLQGNLQWDHQLVYAGVSLERF